MSSSTPALATRRSAALRVEAKAAGPDALSAALRVVELDAPQGVPDGSAVVEVLSAGVNPSDVKAVLGAMPHAVWRQIVRKDARRVRIRLRGTVTLLREERDISRRRRKASSYSDSIIDGSAHRQHDSAGGRGCKFAWGGKPVVACGWVGSFQATDEVNDGLSAGRASKRIEGGSMATSTSVPAWDTVALAKQFQTIASQSQTLMQSFLSAADELIVVSDVYEHAARLRSFELIAQVADADHSHDSAPIRTQGLVLARLELKAVIHRDLMTDRDAFQGEVLVVKSKGLRPSGHSAGSSTGDAAHMEDNTRTPTVERFSIVGRANRVDLWGSGGALAAAARRGVRRGTRDPSMVRPRHEISPALAGYGGGTNHYGGSGHHTGRSASPLMPPSCPHEFPICPLMLQKGAIR